MEANLNANECGTHLLCVSHAFALRVKHVCIYTLPLSGTICISSMRVTRISIVFLLVVFIVLCVSMLVVLINICPVYTDAFCLESLLSGYPFHNVYTNVLFL